MKNLKLFLAMVLIACVVISCAQISPIRLVSKNPVTQLQEQIDKILNDPEFSNAFWGVMIQSLKNDQIIYARNESQGFAPASNLKLYTTAASLALLGPEFRYETPIVYQGDIDASGTLNGDVIIIGSGDPSITGRYSRYLQSDYSTDDILNEWVLSFQSAGIKRINGHIIGDDTIFSPPDYCSSWELGYIHHWYAAPSTGLAINQNCYEFSVSPADEVGKPANVDITPHSSYVTLTNNVITTAAEAPRSVYFFREPYNNNVTFSGFIPLDAEPYEHFASIFNGTLYAATLLRERLIQNDIPVDGDAKDIDEFPDKESRFQADKMVNIHTHISPPIAKIIAIINKPSQNFYADMLLKTLGHEFGRRGSFNGGEQVVRDFLYENVGAEDADNLVMEDGSGLSRKDLVQPRHTVALLRYMIKRPYGKIFYDSLPIAGVDGTISRRMRGTAAENNVHAKTGYISRVRALSGYVDTKEGEKIVFCTMANQYTVPTRLINEAQDKICELLANFSR